MILLLLLNMDSIELGNKIKEARLAEGLTQAQLGAMVEMQRNNISRIEAGKHTITLPVLEKIAKALNRKNEFLLPK